MPVSRSARPSLSPDDGIIGSVVGGRYRVTSLIGRGGMAAVYRAVDQSLPREVALKLMLPGMADPDEMRRQRNEIDTLAALNHHALVTLFDAGTEKTPAGERAFLVMEFVDGPNLREVMTAPLPSAQVAHLGADIAEALHYMHGRGIVHRDVKPANILLAHSELPDRRFHAKLADFGIARLIDGTRLTSTGIIIGSASYLSPEQARGGEVAGASDVYSLGLVLLEALTGEKAFPGNTIETISARLNREPIVPDTLGEAWAQLLANMTALDAEHRPPPMEVAVAARELSNSRESTDASGGAPIGLRAPLGIDDADDDWTSPRATRVYTAVVTGATEVMNRPEASTEVQTHVSSSSPRRSELAPTAPKPPFWMIHRKTISFTIAAAVVIAATVGAVAWSNSQPPAAPPAPSYPAVSGTLGTHLKQLQESVTP
ncbi:MAG: serine/threonine-protein kinase [Terrimesophilobacter sp.]